MYSILKAKSAEYFSKSTSLLENYDRAQTYKEKRTFFMFLVAYHLKEPLKIVDTISNLIERKIFE